MKNENIKTVFNSIFDFIKNNIAFILLAILLIFVICLSKSCSTQKKQKHEISRLENNIKAMTDTLHNYRENGKYVAKMRAYQLKINELSDSLEIEKKRPPVSIIQYTSIIRDSIVTNTIIVRDTFNMLTNDNGTIYAKEKTEYGKSSRDICVAIPYKIKNGELVSENANIVLNQNIWTEASLIKDKKTNETYIKLKTDYPITFNNGLGILVDNSEQYENTIYKKFGVGFGLQAGYGLNLNKNGAAMGAYLGVGISLNWNPKCMQF